MSDEDFSPSGESHDVAPPPEGAEPPPDTRASRARPRRFRRWRRSRPFWGGLFTLIGGLEIATLPLTAYRIMLVTPSVVLAALVGAVIAILGLLLWLTPSHNKLYGLLTILLGIASFITSNVGGFLIGGLLAIIGGALGFAWVVVDRPAPAEGAAPQGNGEHGSPGAATSPRGNGPEPGRA